MLDQQLLASVFAPGIVHHTQIMPGHIRHHGIFIIGRFDLLQKILRHALQLAPREFDRLLRLGDIRLVIRRHTRQLLAHPLDLVALRLG